jgi:hypothetical protein
MESDLKIIEDIKKKHNDLDREFDILFEKYKFNDIIYAKKTLNSNFEYNKVKFLLKKNPTCFNYINHFSIYKDILQNEKDFVLFSIKDNCLESNIKKGANNYIISQHGYRWFKIITRSADNINNSVDPDYYENYCIFEDVQKYINDVANMQYLPFCELPNYIVLNKIKNLNINYLLSSDFPLKSIPKSSTYFDKCEIINLDVNVVVTICSELSNLSEDYDVPENILKKCAGTSDTLNDVRENKIFILDQINKYKKRIICQSAYNKLMDFIRCVKFCPKELERIKNIVQTLDLTIVPDQITDRFKNINHPNQLANCIFGTADYYRAVTITSFDSYISHAKQRRICVYAIVCKSVEFTEKYLYHLK